MRIVFWGLFAILGLLTSLTSAEQCDPWYTNTPYASSTNDDIINTTDAMLGVYSDRFVLVHTNINWFYLSKDIGDQFVPVINTTCPFKPTFEVVRNTAECISDAFDQTKCQCANVPGITDYFRLGIKLDEPHPDDCFTYATNMGVIENDEFVLKPIRVLNFEYEGIVARSAHLIIEHPFYSSPHPEPKSGDTVVAKTEATKTKKTAKAEIGTLFLCFFGALLVGFAFVAIVVGVDCMLVRIAKNETTIQSASTTKIKSNQSTTMLVDKTQESADAGSVAKKSTKSVVTELNLDGSNKRIHDRIRG